MQCLENKRLLHHFRQILTKLPLQLQMDGLSFLLKYQEAKNLQFAIGLTSSFTTVELLHVSGLIAL